MTKMTKTKIALATLLLAGTTSASLATEFDPNPANRYPAYTGSAARAFQSAPVRLDQGRYVAPRQRFVPQAPFDRESLPRAGGVG
jgi:hypothetical protein